MTTLTPVELAMMKSLWRRKTGSVREVQMDLLPDRKLAYTTVMTVLDRMFRKGVLRRSKESRAHIYEPACSQSELRSEAVTVLLEDHFGGSRSALRAFLDDAQSVAVSEIAAEAVPPAPRGAMDESLL